MIEQPAPSSPRIVGHRNTAAQLGRIAEIAAALGSEQLALDASRERQRLAEARFFVACVGQFKRGKSTLLNALVGESVLPVGVVPVTSVITILRHGDQRTAAVRFTSGRSQDIRIEDLATLVDERQNPGNRREVAAVEVFLPSAMLAGGLCLVDTPGLGSVLPNNATATIALVPQIDVALMVVGFDPPMSGAELSLVQDVARQADRLLVVLNKADQTPADQREEVVAFTRKTLQERLGRPVEPIFEVSALERLQQQRVTRDWPLLEAHLRRLADQAREHLVETAAVRAVRRLGRRLLAEIDERERALRTPLAETGARVERLQGALADLDRSLRDLRFLFDAVENDLGQDFERERLQFVRERAPSVEDALGAWVSEEGRRLGRPVRRSEAFAMAQRMAEHAVAGWLTTVEPRAEALYREASRRFIGVANDHVARLAGDVGGLSAEDMPAEAGFCARRQFIFTSLMHLTGGSPRTWLIEFLAPRWLRENHVTRVATAYVAHILDSNSHRIENDFRERTRQSRLCLERDIRTLLAEALASARRALSVAAAKQRMSAAGVGDEMDELRHQREELICAVVPV